MLPEEVFKEKYNTTYSQRREEEYLEKVSTEDREIYSDVEILTGLSASGKLNKFFQTGSNKNKKYDTVKSRFISQFKKFVDQKLEDGKEEEVFERMWKSSKNGSFAHLQFLFERIAGKEEENINLNVNDISFTLEPDDNAKERQNKNLKKDKE